MTQDVRLLKSAQGFALIALLAATVVMLTVVVLALAYQETGTGFQGMHPTTAKTAIAAFVPVFLASATGFRSTVLGLVQAGGTAVRRAPIHSIWILLLLRCRRFRRGRSRALAGRHYRD